MEVIVSKKDLSRALARCQGVADKKSTMPVLGNVLLEADESGALRLSATDLYLAVSGSVSAQVENPGTIAVGARDLFDRIKMMPDGQIAIATKDTSATTIRAVGSARRYTLHGVPGEEFPALPQPDDAAKELTLGVDALSRLIAATHFSISTDDTRLHLNSALFEWEGKRVRMVTTDGHRLSKAELEVGGDAKSSMLIPLKGIQELKRLCDEARGESGDAGASELTLVQSGPNAFFRLGGFRFSVKLVDAQFPPYEQVIPDTSERTVRIPRLEAMEALKAVSVAASDRTGGVKVTLGGNKIRFETESPESGEGFDEVTVDYDSEQITVGINARYFIDVLAAIDDDDVTMGLSGELDPALIKPASESTQGSYVAVIMPMRI